VIVVGVDGSDESKKALAWALDEARLRHTALRVVNAWQLPVFDLSGHALSDLLDPAGFERQALHVIDQALGDLEGGDSGVEIEKLAPEDAPVPALVEASESAELLVVGSRGRGGFTGLLLGSVSQQCAQHATCPVVVVRQRNGNPAPAEPSERRLP
jgi:nucleotide-binding universal stress UspA family protein